MKIIRNLSVLLFFLIIVGIFSGCTQREQFPGQNIFRAQDSAMKYLRETIANPSVFTLNTGVLVDATTRGGEKLPALTCADMWGESFTVSEKGYFLTNDHVVSVPVGMQEECQKQVIEYFKKEKVDVSPNDIHVFPAYMLVGADGSKISVTLVKSWAPEIDMALLHVTEQTRKTFKPVVFSDALSFSDEAVATIGTPLNLKDSIIIGKIISPNTVRKGTNGESLMFNAGAEEGNSGGLLVSVHDMKAIGMTTRVIPVEGTMVPTPYVGAIPAWIIKKELKEVNME
jgi:S1-C subfamily serine protease